MKIYSHRLFEIKISQRSKIFGVILKDDMSINGDVIKFSTTFLKQFNSMFCKFNFSNIKLLVFLFKSIASPLHELEWFNME